MSDPDAEGRASAPLDVLVAYVPPSHTEALLAALFAAGAGAVGEYRECAWVTSGTGRFRPVGAARPTVGLVGELELLPEDRVELVLERPLRRQVVAALRAAHPYETPAFHLIESADPDA
ncbi:hypothetical protein DFJ68_0809 [Terracoccus luteus]|uniref:NGG1p interacting factor NIF3 n=1 Tax=Terracoccus luteus TaxID=53356 RepID=A0A495Y080_9MICO|nr:hypothetical protein [Terracoccus luteus]RKT77388.1 hypothetical protein DFJ68_0809 [Terracoccus luteus]